MVEIDKSAEPKHIVLIGDLVASRELADRELIQERLLATLAEINAHPGATHLLAPVELSAGDEVQALVEGGALALLLRLADGVAPARFAFGLGLGALSVQPEGERRVLHMDGPCFHAARAALVLARRLGRWVRSDSFPPPCGQALDALFALLGAIRAEWTAKQARTVRIARTKPLQKDVARELGVSPSVVSESLRAAHFEIVREAEAAIEELIRESLRLAASAPSHQGEH